MRLLSKAALAALLALGLATVGRAEPVNPLLPVTGTREVSVRGIFQFEPGDLFQIDGRYGPFLNPNLQVGAEFGYRDPEGGDSTTSLGAFANYHFPGASATLPYVGLFLGYVDAGGSDGIGYGLQAGVKHFLNSTVAANAELQYRDSDEAGAENSIGIVFGLSIFLR